MAVPTKLSRVAAVERAHTFVGVKEHPAGSNRGPQIDVWQKRTNGVVGYPWCGAFVYCMFADVGTRILAPLPALVQSWVDWAAAVGDTVTRPLRGDVVCFDWNRDNWHDHIGLVDRVLALRWSRKRFVGLIRTVEGNTSAGNDSNGGQVQVRLRWVNDKTVFVRIPGNVPNV